MHWSWKVVEVNHIGEQTIVNQCAQQLHRALAARCFIHQVCTILNFKGRGLKYNVFIIGLQPVILISSSKNDNQLRCLRVWLRWFKHGKSQDYEDLSAADLAS